MGFRLHIPTGVLASGASSTDVVLLGDLSAPRIRPEVEYSVLTVPTVDGTYPLWTIYQNPAMWITLSAFRNAGVWYGLLTVVGPMGTGNYYTDPIEAPVVGQVYRAVVDLWPGAANIFLFNVTSGELTREMLAYGNWVVNKFLGQTYAIPPTRFYAGADQAGGSTWGVQLSAVEVW